MVKKYMCDLVLGDSSLRTGEVDPFFTMGKKTTFKILHNTDHKKKKREEFSYWKIYCWETIFIIRNESKNYMLEQRILKYKLK